MKSNDPILRLGFDADDVSAACAGISVASDAIFGAALCVQAILDHERPAAEIARLRRQYAQYRRAALDALDAPDSRPRNDINAEPFARIKENLITTLSTLHHLLNS